MNWIIGISGSDMDNVITYRVSGTKEQVKEHLLSKIVEDKDEPEDLSSWDFGTEDTSEIEERPDGSLYGFGCFDYYHNDYTATPEMEVLPL